MSRRTQNQAGSIPGSWTTIEAEQFELEAYVTTRLGGDVETEPAWVRDALQASWPQVIAEADAAAC